ncbi:hypothetical protein BC827DRAFT_1214963 [Russula dissimulans]|nr:hypothetical protein BC827DRAFT_1214963 [Russula dissimulans]
MSNLNDNITSYNTGGMTSSFLEVLAGLTLSMEEYVDLMLLDLPPSRLLFSPLKTNHALTPSEAPSDSSLGRCQDVALLDLAVPQNSQPWAVSHLIFVDYCFVHLLSVSA